MKNLFDFEFLFCQADLWDKIDQNVCLALIIDPFNSKAIKLIFKDAKTF